jgi:hypothetical protein
VTTERQQVNAEIFWFNCNMPDCLCSVDVKKDSAISARSRDFSNGLKRSNFVIAPLKMGESSSGGEGIDERIDVNATERIDVDNGNRTAKCAREKFA